MILLARVLLSSSRPAFLHSHLNLDPTMEDHLLDLSFSLLLQNTRQTFMEKIEQGSTEHKVGFSSFLKSRFQDVDNKEINQISFIKCSRCVQKIVGQCNLFELMVAISDLTPTSSSSASKNTKTKSTNK